MSVDAEKLLQLIHAARTRTPLPAELGPWLAALALSSMSTTDRVAARDACLRRAASLVPGGPWAKVTTLRDEIRAVRDEWTLHSRFPPPPGSITAHVVAALLIAPDAPSSVSQLLRIIDDEDDARYCHPAT
jgi:hypothetical protein